MGDSDHGTTYTYTASRVDWGAQEGTMGNSDHGLTHTHTASRVDWGARTPSSAIAMNSWAILPCDAPVPFLRACHIYRRAV